MVAFHYRPNRQEAITSTELVQANGETRFYNSLKLRLYTKSDDIRTVIDALAAQRVHVERWLPKASLNRALFDLRILMIAGEPRHVVVRQSRSPMTNLHLGNRRGDTRQLLSRLGDTVWQSIQETCRCVANCFPRSLQLGVDLLVTPDFREHAVLEVNAFGDLLPGVLDRGQDTYTAQVAAIVRRHSLGKPH